MLAKPYSEHENLMVPLEKIKANFLKSALIINLYRFKQSTNKLLRFRYLFCFVKYVSLFL